MQTLYISEIIEGQVVVRLCRSRPLASLGVISLSAKRLEMLIPTRLPLLSQLVRQKYDPIFS